MAGKTSKSEFKKIYKCIRFKDHKEISHDKLAEMFSYESNFIKKDKTMDCGFNYPDNLDNLITDIINNSNFDLFSVSEDAHSMTYHFIGWKNKD